jgi:predicted HTH domain antitoxin
MNTKSFLSNPIEKFREVKAMTLEVSLPDEFLKYYKGSRDKLEKLNRIVLAIELYLENKVSIGKAAELSGLPFDKFHDELAKRKIKRRGEALTAETIEKELMAAKSHLK